MPFDPARGQFISDTIPLIDSLSIREEDRANTYSRNAERLLHLAYRICIEATCTQVRATKARGIGDEDEHRDMLWLPSARHSFVLGGVSSRLDIMFSLKEIS